MDPASTSFVLGYHGCDRSLAEQVLSGEMALRHSHNDYDLLGDGVYFWEHNAGRAFEFAGEVARRPRQWQQRIKVPAVVGAIIDLRYCLNLLDTRFIVMVREAYEQLAQSATAWGVALPQNTGSDDRLRRHLDCAVLRTLHQTREGKVHASFDAVRAAFVEGGQLYPDAGFSAKNHIQICVRNPACILG